MKAAGGSPKRKVSIAQSGGKSSKFNGGKGAGGGRANPQATGGRAKGKVKVGAGLTATIIDAGGDKSLKRQSGGAKRGMPKGFTGAGVRANTRTYRPADKGKGGSR